MSANLKVTLLIITGTMGSGKTTILAEASDILKRLDVHHAAIDLDALGIACLPNCLGADAAMYENLRLVAQNYRQLGINRFLLARAIETRADLDRCCQAIGANQTTLCRLVARERTMKERVAQREYGILRQEFIARVSRLDAVLDKAGLEDFRLKTEDCPVTEVARQMLTRCSWIPK